MSRRLCVIRGLSQRHMVKVLFHIIIAARWLFVAAIPVPVIATTMHARVRRWLVSLLALPGIAWLLLLLIFTFTLAFIVTTLLTHVTYFHWYNFTAIITITAIWIVSSIRRLWTIACVVWLPIVHCQRHSLRLIYSIRIMKQYVWLYVWLQAKRERVKQFLLASLR